VIFREKYETRFPFIKLAALPSEAHHALEVLASRRTSRASLDEDTPAFEEHDCNISEREASSSFSDPSTHCRGLKRRASHRNNPLRQPTANADGKPCCFWTVLDRI